MTRGDDYPRPIAWVFDAGDRDAALRIAAAVRDSTKGARVPGAVYFDHPSLPEVPDALINTMLNPVDDRGNILTSHWWIMGAMYMRRSVDSCVSFCLISRSARAVRLARSNGGLNGTEIFRAGSPARAGDFLHPGDSPARSTGELAKMSFFAGSSG